MTTMLRVLNRSTRNKLALQLGKPHSSTNTQGGQSSAQPGNQLAERFFLVHPSQAQRCIPETVHVALRIAASADNQSNSSTA